MVIGNSYSAARAAIVWRVLKGWGVESGDPFLSVSPTYRKHVSRALPHLVALAVAEATSRCMVFKRWASANVFFS